MSTFIPTFITFKLFFEKYYRVNLFLFSKFYNSFLSFLRHRSTNYPKAGTGLIDLFLMHLEHDGQSCIPCALPQKKADTNEGNIDKYLSIDIKEYSKDIYEI